VKDPTASAHVAIVRIEQLYPFPAQRIAALLAEIAPEEVIWAQEEPRNMGAWEFVNGRFGDDLEQKLRYVGRLPAASPATGSHKRHVAEQQAILDEALR
jgi:2-oxoglutarate dehydrogenase E1 component